MKYKGIFFVSLLFLSSCISVKYQISSVAKNSVSIKSGCVLFDFSNQASNDTLLNHKILHAIEDNGIRIIDTITNTPLSFKNTNDQEYELKSKSPDAIIVIKPLNAVINTTKYGYGLNSVNYLIEIKSSIDLLPLKKCVVSIKHPDTFGNIQPKLTEVIKNLLK